ncbi:MAG: hypothetical protein PVJ67_03940 [Candidatus Pacearchaeota archaeon]|jgi:hypothetical protein
MKRRQNETYNEYKKRRKREQEYIIEHLKGKLFYDSSNDKHYKKNKK